MITTAELQVLRGELVANGMFEHRTAETAMKLVLLLLALGAVLAGIVLLPWWCGLFLVPLAAVPAVTAAMIGHEAAHGSFAASPRNNELVLHLVFPLFGGLGAQYWKHKHNHLHHGHPNILGRDPDVNVWPMALSSEEHARSGPLRRWVQRNLQGYLFWPLTLLLAFTMRIDTWSYVWSRARSRGFDRALGIDLACLVGHYSLWLAAPMLWFGVWPVLLVYAGLWATSGLLLALVFAPAHIGLPVMAIGRGGGWQQQLDTTRNLAMPGWLSWFFVGLDHQVEHHLFPRIPHQNLGRASRIVAPWCAQVGAPYHSIGYAASIRHVTRHVRISWQAVPEVAVVKNNAGKLKSLTVGSRVFYPGHGVASVAAIEERELGGGVQKFYVLALELDPGVKLFLPVDKVDQAAVRELVSAAKARQLLKMLAEEFEPAEVKTDPSSRKLRATNYSDGLRSGSPERYTEILRDLLARSRAGKLAPSEQQTLTLALDMFVGEVSASLERPPDEVRAEVAKVTAAA
jgi:fatty acid desaturase/RNA polymerase-interacting CarD/CdnL/TRCF family regulator